MMMRELFGTGQLLFRQTVKHGRYFAGTKPEGSEVMKKAWEMNQELFRQAVAGALKTKNRPAEGRTVR